MLATEDIETMLGEAYLAEARSRFRLYRMLADRALEQVGDDQFFVVNGYDSNSIGVLVKHLAGNMRSRFTDFLTTDGEKPDRNRDDEFERYGSDTRDELELALKRGWALVLATVDALEPDQLLDTVYIRAQPHTVLEALNRQLTHYAYHIGQIVYLAKRACGEDWQSLSIPKGRSESFNQEMMGTDVESTAGEGAAQD